VMKITLFFCAGAILVGAHKSNVNELDGLGRRMPFTMAAFLVGALSIAGLPPLAGAWSKWYLALGAAEGHQVVFIAVLMLSSLLSIGYLVPVAARAFFLPDRSNGAHDPPSGLHEAPVLCVVPPVLTAAGCIALFFLSDPVARLVGAALGGAP
jgi:multicomponent Na+:H+ antiporter subunit D